MCVLSLLKCVCGTCLARVLQCVAVCCSVIQCVAVCGVCGAGAVLLIFYNLCDAEKAFVHLRVAEKGVQTCIEARIPHLPF